MLPTLVRSLHPSLARAPASALGGGRLPWEPEGGGGLVTPATIFGASDLRLWLSHTLGIALGTPPDVAGWADQSAATNDAAQTTAADRPDLVVGTGVDFDGTSDFMVVPDDASLDFTTALTIGLRVRFETIAGGGVPLCKSPTGGGAWVLQAVLSAIWWRFGGLANYSVTPTLSAGVWYSLVWVFNGSGATNADRARFWINGVEQAQTFSGTIPATIPVTADDLYLARWNNLAAQHFNGDMRAVVLAAAVPTPGQIAALTAYLGGS